MKPYLKFYLNNKNSIDSVVCTAEEVALPEDGIKWVYPGDIEEFIPFKVEKEWYRIV